MSQSYLFGTEAAHDKSCPSLVLALLQHPYETCAFHLNQRQAPMMSMLSTRFLRSITNLTGDIVSLTGN
ncbi:hypothetical protein AB6A40_006414 [Gnathostoma spinigerum]|uniref:Uncharacterized protein n=1 Tax=Gnathostoma spinigerum TaxID=75299 RepID=A0ABD6EJH0_9BILA